MLTTIRAKCSKCGKYNGYRAEYNPTDSSYSALKIETCKKCGNVIAEPLVVIGRDQDESFSDMMTSEKEVATFLDSLELPWIFEFPIFVFDERKRPRVWTPDFFIPKLGVYIEVCGSKDFEYDYREKIYAMNNVQIIFLHFFKKKEYWRKFLVEKIKEVEEQRHQEAVRLIGNFSGKSLESNNSE